MKWFFQILTACCLMLTISACKRSQASQIISNNIPASSEIPEPIEALYTEHCSGCHGKKASRFTSEGFKYGKTLEQLNHSIQSGYVKDGMPAYKHLFSDQEVSQLSEYILKNIDNPPPSKTPIGKKYTTELFDVFLEPIITDLDKPWGMTQLHNGNFLIAEHQGSLLMVDGQKTTNIKGLPPISQHGQGGLMDVILHPNFSANQLVYLSYTKPHPNRRGLYTTAIGRGQIAKDSIIQFEELFEALPYSDKRFHFGCRMAFDDEGYLWFSVGDRGNREENPQALDNHCGKIHRIHDDGAIPKDNPFTETAPAYASIYSYGHRNPQGLSIHPETREIWEHEHGPKGGDELNIPEKGLNYGWPVISYGINYSGTKFTDITNKDGMEQPVIHWTPSIAPCGMDFVEGERYPTWKNNALVGSLKFEYLERVVIENDKVVHQEKLFEGIARVRNVMMGLDGYIYLATESPGVIYRLVPE